MTTEQAPNRLSKRQSLSTTTVLFRTTFTQTMILNLVMSRLIVVKGWRHNTVTTARELYNTYKNATWSPQESWIRDRGTFSIDYLSLQRNDTNFIKSFKVGSEYWSKVFTSRGPCMFRAIERNLSSFAEIHGPTSLAFLANSTLSLSFPYVSYGKNWFILSNIWRHITNVEKGEMIPAHYKQQVTIGCFTQTSKAA